MTFIKYTSDGKAVIQPAALTLSGLDREETLELHTLENAIVLLKQEMEPAEKAAATTTLLRLAHSLMKICSPSPPKPLRMPASCTITSVCSAWTALFWWYPMTTRPHGAMR